jgi:hypothetical protein
MRWLLSLVCLLSASPAASLALHYEGGVSASRGDYVFTERTTSASWMTGVALESGQATLRVNLPLWFQTSTLLSMTGGGPVPSGGETRSGAVRDSGRTSGRRGARVPVGAEEIGGLRAVIGDPMVQVSLRLVETLETSLGASLSTKIPTTSPDDFGTGEWDVGGSCSLTRRIGSRWLAALDLSYWQLGDMPDLAFRNPVGGSASVTRFSGDWGFSVSGSASSAILPGYDPPVAVGGGVLRRVGAGSWGIQLSIGLSETAADVGASALWRVPLRVR